MNPENNNRPLGITTNEIKAHLKETEATDHDPNIFGPAGRGNVSTNLIEAAKSFNNSPNAETFYCTVIKNTPDSSPTLDLISIRE